MSVNLYIHVNQTVRATPRQVRDELLKHENLDRFFNAKFQIKAPSPPSELAGGVNTIRTVKIGPVTFDEVITGVTDELITYSVVGDAPVKNHTGTIKLNIYKGHCKVDYIIRCESNAWIPSFILEYFVIRDIKSAMFKLANYFEYKFEHSLERGNSREN